MSRPKAALLSTPFDAHGGPDGRAHTLLDFSVNSNPFGPPEGLLEALRHADISTYPDPTSSEAKRAAAEKHSRPTSDTTFGNGTADLIHRLTSCYLERGRTALIAAPTFGEYARATSLQGARVVPIYPYQESEVRPEPLLAAIEKRRPTLVFICHPNNPTGHAWHEEHLLEVAQVCSEQDALLILDLAYLSLSDAPDTPLPESAVQLYSLTKSFTVPGVRVGYAVAPAEVIRVLERAAPPWQVSAHAQHAAVWALSPKGEAFLERTVPLLLNEHRTFQAELRASIEVSRTCTTFSLCEVRSGATFKLEAERAGFRVRDANSFGLPQHVRLATRRPEENAQFLSWLRSHG